MDTTRNRFVDNLDIKCRCCFKKFKHIKESIKITKTIENQIQEITNMEFKISSLYPNSICKPCSLVLKETTTFRNGLIKRQQKLYNLINIDLDTDRTEDKFDNNVKYEDELLFTDSIKMEVDADVKTECYELPSIVIFEAPIISYDAPPIPCNSSPLTDTVAVKNEDLIKEEVLRRSSISSEESEYSKQLAIQRKCDICGNSFKNLQQHKLKIHGPKIPKPMKLAPISKKCSYCGLVCSTVQEAKTHIRQVHLKLRNFFCDFCGFGAIRKYVMRNHMRKHIEHYYKNSKKHPVQQLRDQNQANNPVKSNKVFKNQKLYKKCYYCGIIFRSYALNTHIRHIHLKINNFFCDICGRGTYIISEMRKHMRKHIDRKFRRKLCCLFCPKVFCSNTSRRIHLENTHLDKGFNECFCGENFETFNELRNHLLNVHNRSFEIDPTEQPQEEGPKPNNKKQCLICKKYLHRLKPHMETAHSNIPKVRKVSMKNLNNNICYYCGKVFKNRVRVNLHVRVVHLKEKNCFCDICGFGTINRGTMSKHMKVHRDCPRTEHKTFYCIYCTKKFYGHRSLLKEHLQTVHSDKKRHECFCGIRYKLGVSLRNHLLNVHNRSFEIDPTEKPEEVVFPKPKDKKQCLICKKYLNNIELHMKKVHSNIPKVSKKNLNNEICHYCGKVLKNGGSVNTHVREVHLKEKNCFCDICGFGAFNRSTMTTHMIVHKDRPRTKHETFSCIHCTNIYYTRKGLKDHHQTVHPGKKTRECFCGYLAGSELLLKRHIDIIHKNLKEPERDRTFVCPTCGKGFKGRQALTKHMKVHENKVFSCDQCPKTFNTKASLSSHDRYHKEPQFSCDFEDCNKKFYRITCLKSHIKVHLGQRDFLCHLCDKKCFKADHLNKHLLSFHKIQGYKCEVPGCTTTMFAKKEFYRTHLSTKHACMLTVQNFIDNLENMESE